MKTNQIGIMYSIIAYVIWGLLPIYWKWLGHISAVEILAHRILWSFCFSLVLIFLLGKRKQLKKSLAYLREQKKQLFLIVTAAIIITFNWFLYIWAVNSNQVTEASLGYYINPLVSVFLGMVFLKEKLSKVQIVSYLFAIVGVLILTISYGTFPFIAFSLALSFAFYGLVKKFVRLDAIVGLAIETLVVIPFALLYVFYLSLKGEQSLFQVSMSTDLLLIGAGIATALPLIFFAKGAQRIPLSLLGILQYIAPTFMLILGIVIYHEPFTNTQLSAFIFIWIALVLFSLSNMNRYFHSNKKVISKKATM